VQLPTGGSAVAAIQRFLGDGVRVVSAFQNVLAHHLKQLDHEVDCDVLVCGDNLAARETVIELAAEIGLRAFHAGPIINSAAAEALTSILIAIHALQGARRRHPHHRHTRALDKKIINLNKEDQMEMPQRCVLPSGVSVADR